MPRMDGTGPQGLGELSGRKMGRCRGAEAGRGQRRRSRNRACGRFLLVGAGQDRSFVESCISRLQTEIKAMQTRLNDLKSQLGE